MGWDGIGIGLGLDLRVGGGIEHPTVLIIFAAMMVKLKDENQHWSYIYDDDAYYIYSVLQTGNTKESRWIVNWTEEN